MSGCRHWPVRSYPWGVAESLNSAHSDVPALKRLLIELSFDDLKKITDDRYYTSYRPKKLDADKEAEAYAGLRAHLHRN
jgi:septin family protein